jgi:NAD(P)-dependent dehydrogenase (short-subunit alcohol dehydrogenase family)
MFKRFWQRMNDWAEALSMDDPHGDYLFRLEGNAVLPSIIDTAATRASMPNADPAKWVAPKELADVILFASDAASAVTGALLAVNGRV